MSDLRVMVYLMVFHRGQGLTNYLVCQSFSCKDCRRTCRCTKRVWGFLFLIFGEYTSSLMDFQP